MTSRHGGELVWGHGVHSVASRIFKIDVVLINVSICSLIRLAAEALTPFIGRAGCVDFYSLAGSNHSFVADTLLPIVLDAHLPRV